MTARKSPPRCNGTGEAITNRKEKRMPTQSLTSDDLAARITEALEGHKGTHYAVDWSGIRNKYHVLIFVTADFSGEFVEVKQGLSPIIRATGDTLLSVLSSAYARLAVSLPLAVSA
jgi:hypothetical protein